MSPVRHILQPGHVLVLALVMALPTAGRADTRVVRPDGGGDQLTIQAAVNASLAGDVILLEDGVYSGEGNRDVTCGGIDITIRSRSGDRAACVIDCAGGQWETPHRGFVLAGAGRVHIADLTFINGRAEGTGMPTGAGGAVLCTDGTPRFENCVFTDNEAEYGGAVAIIGGSPGFEGCFFRFNTAEQGGAVFCAESKLSLAVCRFENNAGFSGGALGCHTCAVTIDACFFEANLGYYGGAVIGGAGSELLITGSRFRANFATLGGAFHLEDANFTAEHSTIVVNTAGSGGGILASKGSEIHLEHTVVAFNQQGGAMAVDQESSVEVRCSLIYGNAEGDWTGALSALRDRDGNLWEDPGFTAPGQGDFSFAPDSPCRRDRPGCGPMITD